MTTHRINAYLNKLQLIGVLSHLSDRNPSATDWAYPVPTLWVNESSDSAYLLVDNAENAAVWTEIIPSDSSFTQGNDALSFYDITTARPGSPTAGDAYILSSSGVRDTSWTDIGATYKDFVIYDGASWKVSSPAAGSVVYIDELKQVYIYADSTWKSLHELLPFDFQESVLSIADATAAPPSTNAGDRYILDTTAGTVDPGWDGAAKEDLVEYDGVEWHAMTPSEGMMTSVEDLDTVYIYVTAWSPLITSTSLQFNCDTGTAEPDGSGEMDINGDDSMIQTTGDNANAMAIAPTDNFIATGRSGWNGSIIEKSSVTVSSDGAVITTSVEQDGGGDLTVVFSDGYYSWDTTPADTVTLTAGTDTSPTLNYVYFLQSNKTLTASTSGWPAAEHAPIATVLCQSAASLQTDGAYKVHAWTDHIVASDSHGHLADINYWIRQQPATWQDGVAQTFTITTNGGAADNVILTTASGNVLQLHPHAFPAFSGTPDVYVVNDNSTPYDVVTDLNALLTDATGSSMSGRYFSLVIWGCVSEDTGDCKLFCNLPTGSYNNQAGLQADEDNYSVYNIPDAFRGTGFLIAEWKLRHQAAASGTWTSVDEIDLRGLFPALSAGGGSALVSSFADNAFEVYDESDTTKKLAFQVSGVTTATTRTLTVPDADGQIGLVTSLAQYGTAVATGGTTLKTIAPSATSGVPYISQGSSSDPAFGTAVVAGGGTGATSLTDHGLLVGSGTSPVTALGVATNGQLPIGSAGADPVLATLTATANETTVANGAGSITLGLADNAVMPGTGSMTLPTGTTAQRSGTPVEGMTRYNSDDEITEVYQNGQWVNYGGWYLYSTTSISAATSTEDITVPTAHKECLLIAFEVAQTSGSSYLEARFSEDGGSTFLNFYGSKMSAGTGSTYFASSLYAPRDTNSAGNKRLTLHMHNFGLSQCMLNGVAYDTSSAAWANVLLQGGGDVNTIRLQLNSGTMASGTVYLWVK